MNNQKKYQKTIRSLFPIYGSHEKRFFMDFKNSISEYIENCPNADFSELEMKFGSPANVISDYLSNVETDYLSKQLSNSRYMRITCACIAMFFITAMIVWFSYNYKSYLEFQKALPAIEKTVIKYDD